MTLTELKYIVAVAKEGHFGRAAKSVFVSQPTLSIGIKKLEEELGVAIFERLSNKVIPTPTGQRILEAAQKTLADTDTIRAIADEAKGEFQGDVKLGAIYTICPYLLPKMIPDLQRHAPKIRLYIKEDYTNHLIDGLQNADLDVAVVSLPIARSNLLEIKPISEENFHVILPKNHPLAQKSHLNSSDLKGEQVFLLGGGNCFRAQVLQACPTCISSDSDGTKLIEGGSLDTIRMMVASGLGISVFPEMALTEDANITVRPFTEPSPKRQIAIVWRKSFIQQDIIDTIEASILRCSQGIKKNIVHLN